MRTFFFLLLLPVLVPAIAQQSEYTYLRLEGTIGTQPVVMHLHLQDPYEPDSSIKSMITGVYYYKRYEAPISVYGDEKKSGEISLSESSGPTSEGLFSINRNIKGEWMGNWKNGGNGTPVAVTLREAYPKSTPRFTGKTMEAEKAMFPGRENTPKATVSVTYLEPTAEVEEQLHEFLNNEIPRQILGDSLAKFNTTPEKAFESIRKASFDAYPGELLNEINPDSLEYGYMYNYDESVTMAIQYNDNNRLTIAVTHYYYSGGAHGNYATGYFSYDTGKRKAIKLSDLLKPGYHKVLERALNRAARQRAGLKPSEPINSAYFVESVPPTENFYPTGKGLVFSYPPYEIASYADGQVELFVSFEELKVFLK